MDRADEVERLLLGSPTQFHAAATGWIPVRPERVCEVTGDLFDVLED